MFFFEVSLTLNIVVDSRQDWISSKILSYQAGILGD